MAALKLRMPSPRPLPTAENLLVPKSRRAIAITNSQRQVENSPINPPSRPLSEKAVQARRGHSENSRLPHLRSQRACAATVHMLTEFFAWSLSLMKQVSGRSAVIAKLRVLLFAAVVSCQTSSFVLVRSSAQSTPGEHRKTSEPYTGDLSVFDSPGRDKRLQIDRVMDILGI